MRQRKWRHVAGLIAVALAVGFLLPHGARANPRRSVGENGPDHLFLPLVMRDLPPSPRASTSRVSIASDGTQANNGSFDAAISPDGKFVAFESGSTNLVSGDTNGKTDIFVHDLETGETSLVSVASDGTQANDFSVNAGISLKGRYVVFQSLATNLVPDDTNGEFDIFVHDLQTGETSRVSVASNGTQANDESAASFISADGRYVAFGSGADNLVAGDTNGVWDIFIHDRQTGKTSRVSVASDGSEGNGSSSGPQLTGNSGYVTFTSDASNLVPDDTNGAGDAFVRDLETGTTMLVSVASDGTQGNDDSGAVSISADGRYIVFESGATNLVPDDTNGWNDVFVHDRLTDQTSRASVGSEGTEGNGFSSWSSTSTDGQYVVIASNSSNLVPGDTNGAYDVFIHAIRTAATIRVSLASDGSEANGSSIRTGTSADGRYIVFESLATNLVPGDTNDFVDIFVRDRGE